MNRRIFLLQLGALAALPAGAQQVQDITPFIARITKGAKTEKRGIDVELPQIAENGNSVPLRIRVDSAMTPEDHVKAIHVFAERNPRPRVATFYLGPWAGRAEISTRVRLAGTQRVTVLAELSGNRFWTGPVDVLVTSAACLDEAAL